MKIVRRQRIDSIFTLMVFVIFTVSVLLTLMFSASVYRNVSDSLHTGQNERTALSYVWTKVRSFDELDQIFVSQFHGQSALVINEWHNDESFQTLIYYYDGWLRELFTIAGATFGLADGLPLLKVSDLTFTEPEQGLIRVSAGGQVLMISPRSQVDISSATASG